jgi:hypothetical protein
MLSFCPCLGSRRLPRGRECYHTSASIEQSIEAARKKGAWKKGAAS